ncbi:putative acyltransferase plsB1 [Mycobacterium kiyosense]|uniref:Acyltransferase plsB1 n=2 Tax=Mycobacteriaceae TaxID=1762 RepID=A0AA37PYF1_9MYCO|nr:1-acyl-sn-glycerol-3-phosphate acyltransferase [Mycobacterium avium]GLB82912.1 putative acyltransferase plsB1 [Mycobacterium kiyosense]GLB96202.1 putative acyltransferase plsB1 [Mycobacterium kiyosense]GLD40550.1 putative acyltransferase plsB1 [Mycobacterium kiyosense]
MTVLPGRLKRLLRPNGSAAALSVPGDLPDAAAVLESDEFQSTTAQLAAQLGRNVTDVQVEAAGYVREMAASHVPPVVRAWKALSAWMVRGFQVVIDDDDLAKLRALDRDHALIFLISHRSYLDQFSFPPRLTQEGISPTFGLAGANLNFFPLGTLARRNGFIPVRRATGDVPVYRLALRALVGQMVASGRNLVWSIEGGRSRTGKLRPPRYGLLRYVTDAVESVGSEQTLAVPVSILFDQLPLHEVKLMVSESRGLPKSPENARWLFSYARGLRHRLGRIYINFGSPVPLHERIVALRADGLTDRQVVERIALDICHRLNQVTPVSATAAVCVAMLGEDRALTLDEVCATVAPLARYLRIRGWPVAGGADLTDRATVSQTLHDLVGSGVLTCYAEGPTTVWGIGDDQHLIVAVYRNSAIHVLVMRAIAELALLAIVRTPDATKRTGWEKASAVRELLKFDFFFAGRNEFADELWNEFSIMTGRSHDPSAPLDIEEAARSLHESDLLVAHLVLRPFVDAYRVVAEELLTLPLDRSVDEQELLTRCLRLGRQWSLQHRITEESVSGDMFSTALKMARHRGLLDPEVPEDEVAHRRAALVAELDELQKSIGELARIRRNVVPA